MQGKKKVKKERLDSIPVIHRRLFRMWSEVVRKRANFQCEVCKIRAGEINPINNKKVKLDAHHFLSRFVANNPLKWDPRNGVCVCPKDHKFGIRSFHKNPIVSSEWVRKNRPESYALILEQCDASIDLNNRHVLSEIEAKLEAGLDIAFAELRRIEAEFPREKRNQNKEPLGLQPASPNPTTSSVEPESSPPPEPSPPAL